MELLTSIRDKIAVSQSQSVLSAPKVTLLGASKGQSVEMISTFVDQGITDFGENRVQEAIDKWPELKKQHPDVRLHLIGPLQTNKVKEALGVFDVVQTLDRPKLAEAIAHTLDAMSGCQTKAFFIQVNTGEEPQKSGVSPAETADFIAYCRALKLNVVGLMCVPPVDLQPAPHFALLRKLAADNGLAQLSMGMSDDYETAIRMGSSCVRLGRILFGERS
jgi:pyridoxal phosphate enzyme (YggS family)